MRLAIYCSFLLIIIQCSGDYKKSEQTEVFELKVALNSSPETLHPVNWQSQNALSVIQYLHKSLVRYDYYSSEIIPDLSDGLPKRLGDSISYLINLKQDVLWEIGDTLTPNDLVFSYKLACTAMSNNPGHWQNYAASIKEITQNSDTSVVIKFNEPYVGALEMLTEIFILNENQLDPNLQLREYNLSDLQVDSIPSQLKALSSLINDLEEFQGLGAYNVLEQQQGHLIRLKKKVSWRAEGNDEIHNQNNPERILFSTLSDPIAVTTALRNNDVDIIPNVQVEIAQKIQDGLGFENYTLELVDQPQFSFIAMNSKNPILRDINVRKALTSAVPYDLICNELMHGYVTRSWSSLPQNSSLRIDTLPPPNLDIEHAITTLKKAGWQQSTNGVRSKNGLALELELTIVDIPIFNDIATLIKSEFKKIGVMLKVRALSPQEWNNSAFEHNYQLWMGTWAIPTGYYDPRQMWHTSSYENSGFNITGFGNKRTDSLIALRNRTFNTDVNQKIGREIIHEIHDHIPFIYLFYSSRRIVYNKDLDNIHIFTENPGIHLGSLKKK